MDGKTQEIFFFCSIIHFLWLYSYYYRKYEISRVPYANGEMNSTIFHRCCHSSTGTFHFNLSFLRCVITVPKKIFSPLIIYLEIEYYRSIVVIIFLIFEGNNSAEKYGEKFEWKIHRFASILPKLGQPPLQHTCLPSPPLSLRLLQEFREQYHGYEAFLRLPLRDDFIKFALIISPSGNPPARGDEADLFFFLFSRETRRWRDCFLCLLLADYETVIRLPGSRLSRFISSPLVFSFFF